MLTPHEETVLLRIRQAGPRHVFSHEFQDQKSQAAVRRLISLKLIKPDFELREDQLDKYVQGQQVVDKEDFDLFFQVTERGQEYCEEIYRPSFLFSRRVLFPAAIAALAVMILLALWLI